MPRSVDDILANGDELARRFEEYEPRPEDRRDPVVYMALQRAPGQPDEVIATAVSDARSDGFSWRTIGSLLGMSEDAARRRFDSGRSSASGSHG